jgi:hypothetical protein
MVGGLDGRFCGSLWRIADLATVGICKSPNLTGEEIRKAADHGQGVPPLISFLFPLMAWLGRDEEVPGSTMSSSSCLASNGKRLMASWLKSESALSWPG